MRKVYLKILRVSDEKNIKYNTLYDYSRAVPYLPKIFQDFLCKYFEMAAISEYVIILHAQFFQTRVVFPIFLFIASK